MIPDRLPAHGLRGRRRCLLRRGFRPTASARIAITGRCAGTGRSRMFVLLLAWAVVGAALGGCSSAPVGAPNVSNGQAAGRTRAPHRKITQEELTQRLMAFADRYLSRISEATDQLKRDATDPKVRRAAHATKFFPGSAIMTFAAEPDPVAGMLDILTVVTLERMVWQDTG